MNVPQDIEAERSLLASIINREDEALAWEALGKLEPADFLAPLHRETYAAITRQVRSGAGLDLVSIRGTIDPGASRPALFSELVDLCLGQDIGNPALLIGAVYEKSRLRHLLRLAAELERCVGGGDSPEALVTRFIGELAGIASGGDDSDSESLGDLVPEVADGASFLPPGQKPTVGCFGIRTLDTEVEIPRGEPTLIAARPGCGKTSLAVQVACESAKKGEEILFISLELPKPRIKAKFASYLTGVPMVSWLTGKYLPEEGGKLANAISRMPGKIRITSPEQGSTWAALEASIRKHQALYGTNMVIIDYFGYIGIPNPGKDGNMAYAFAEVMKGITRCSKSLDLAMIICAQLTKESAKSGAPSLSDIADTDRPARDANLALMLYKIKDQTWIKVPKNRYGKAGWDNPVEFDGVSGKFSHDYSYTEAV